MREDFAPALHPVEIAALRPTQMTVGLREVDRKRAEWRKRAERDGPDFLGRHMIPVILGPKSVPFVIDHHHLARALHVARRGTLGRRRFLPRHLIAPRARLGSARA